jgi:hypothetical protein
MHDREALVSQADTKLSSSRDGIRVEGNVTGTAYNVLQRDLLDARALEANHHTERFVGNGPDRRRAETKRQQAIIGGGRATPLQVTQD